MAEAPVGLTRDALFGGRLELFQSTSGHRAGTDAVLLATAVPSGFEGTVFDAGAGVGTVGLAVARASPQAKVTLIENDPTCSALAARNIGANNLEDRVSIADCDLLAPAARRPLMGKASLVLSNPPFHRAERVRASPDRGRRAAHVLADGGLPAWLDACVTLLAPKGTLILIHQATALPEILGELTGRLGAITLLVVHPRPGKPATRVLVRGTRGSRAPFRIAGPLVLHDGNGFTPEATALHQGACTLAW